MNTMLILMDLGFMIQINIEFVIGLVIEILIVQGKILSANPEEFVISDIDDTKIRVSKNKCNTGKRVEIFYMKFNIMFIRREEITILRIYHTEI